MTLFKNAGNYISIRYFACQSYNKKSKKEKCKKLCNRKIKCDVLKESAEITKLQTNECLEKYLDKYQYCHE